MKYFILITTALLFQQTLTCDNRDSATVVTTPLKCITGKTESSLTCVDMQECIKECLKKAIEADTTFTISECGTGDWKRIAHLNMTDSSQSCPIEWNEYTTPVRSCGRKDISLATTCDSKLYSTDGYRYNKVCGRALGYRYGYTDAFNGLPSFKSIDKSYVDGLSITHGTNPRNHIWTYASGNSDSNTYLGSCPCIGGGNGVAAPSFVGDNYHCESSGTISSGLTFLTQDVLWDGIMCEGGCCKSSLPWFSTTLHSSSSDDVEVRICGVERHQEDVPIKLLEIYVQ